MEFGMFYELFSRAPHDTISIKQAYDEAIEQIKLAERSGFGYVWEVEHHFQTRGSKSAAPELFLTAIARETSTIRLGHGVVLLTMNHPVRVAERAAVLDLLSDGRLEFGTGRGTTDSELGGFNVTPEDSRPMWEESVRLLPKLWTEEEVEHNGKYWSFPARSIVPKPLQKPHPPMWVSGVSPRTFELAGEMGLGILSFSLSAPGQSEAAITEYRRRIASAEPVGKFVNNKVAAFTIGCCLEDRRRAHEVAAMACGSYSIGTASLAEQFNAADTDAWQKWAGRQYYNEVDTSPEVVQPLVDDSVVCVGTPDDCIRVIKHWEEVGVDQIMLIMQTGRMPHDVITESIENFGKYVLPEFKKSEVTTVA